MYRPTDSQLLDIWERGYSLRSAERCALLLSASCIDLSDEQISSLTLGEVEARLIRLRQQLFGDTAELTCLCPSCNEAMEMSLSLHDLLQDVVVQREVRVESGGQGLRVRIPVLSDLLAVQHLPPGRGRRLLLERCVLSMDLISDEAALLKNVDDLTELSLIPNADIVSQAMATADPLANIEIAVTCSECHHSWQAPFHAVTLLWQELNDWAQRLLLQVHTLATSYGWTQRDVMELSRWRRQVYLNMARQV